MYCLWLLTHYNSSTDKLQQNLSDLQSLKYKPKNGSLQKKFANLCHTLSANYEILYVLFCYIFITTPKELRNYCYAHFMAMQTEAQSLMDFAQGHVTSRQQSWDSNPSMSPIPITGSNCKKTNTTGLACMLQVDSICIREVLQMRVNGPEEARRLLKEAQFELHHSG